MSFERSEYKQHIVDSAKPDVSHLRMLERAAVESEAVTGDPHWDYYLSCLQAYIDQTQALRDQLKEQLAGPVVNHDDIMAIKLTLERCNGRLEAWITARDLPKNLIEKGGEAHDLIANADSL